MTALHNRQLHLCLRYRNQPMTVPGLLRTNARHYALTLLFFGASAVFLDTAYGLYAAAYPALAFAVMLLRDIAHVRRAVAIWPLSRQIIDWDRVEELAGIAGSSSAPRQ